MCWCYDEPHDIRKAPFLSITVEVLVAVMVPRKSPFRAWQLRILQVLGPSLQSLIQGGLVGGNHLPASHALSVTRITIVMYKKTN